MLLHPLSPAGIARICPTPNARPLWCLFKAPLGSREEVSRVCPILSGPIQTNRLGGGGRAGPGDVMGCVALEPISVSRDPENPFQPLGQLSPWIWQ